MLVDDPATTVEQLVKIVKGPDFPTAGYIYGMGGIREAYTTGAAPSRCGRRRTPRRCAAPRGDHHQPSCRIR